MAAREAIVAGHIGSPRTLHLAWSFPRSTARRGTAALERDLEAAMLQLADAAMWLLAAEPERLYAWRSDTTWSPLMVANIQCVGGELVALEMTLGSDGYPALRELSLYGLDGAISHRANHHDLLWSRNRAEVLQLAEDGLARQMASWLNQARTTASPLADGRALARNLTLAQMLRASLADSVVAAH
jgi:hypothetical protein